MEWYTLKEFPKYAINKKGVIKNKETGNIKKVWKARNGYYYVDLYKEGKHYKRALHRLLAETFLPNPDNKRTVNHKDGDKTNNSLDNLEWSTDSENIKHAYDNGLQPYKRKHSKEKYIKCLEEVLKGKTLTELAKEVGQSLAQLSLHVKEVAIELGKYEEYSEVLKKQQLQRAKQAGLNKRNKIRLQMLDKDTEQVIKEFSSVTEARDYLNVKSCGPISNAYKGRQKIAYGYKWRRL